MTEINSTPSVELHIQSAASESANLSVFEIIRMAKVYTDDISWQSWGSSDLSDIHHLLTELAKKHPVKYEIEAILDDGKN